MFEMSVLRDERMKRVESREETDHWDEDRIERMEKTKRPRRWERTREIKGKKILKNDYLIKMKCKIDHLIWLFCNNGCVK